MAKAGSQAPAAAKSDNSKYLKTSDDTALEGHLTLIGLMTSGKTVMAATASSQWPGAVPAKKKIQLEDMAWISFDRGGTASLAQLNVNVPHVIDARAIIADKGIEGGIELILEMAKGLVDRYPEIANFALDTVSKLDAVMVEHYKRKHANSSNKYAAWDDVLIRHGRLYNGIDKLNRRMISTFHTNAKLTDASIDQGKARSAMAIVSEESDLLHDITGKSRKLYLSDASLKGAIYARVNKKEGTQRIYLPYGGKQMEGGCRYHEFLDDEEPADFQKVFAKIRAKMGLK